VQFKVEPNDLDVDASRIADALNDISIEKGPSDNKAKRTMSETPLGVDIAKVAAGGKDDRASVFPHGRNLNLLILVVVGASATASLVVGGLIFALASRRRGVAKNVSKLQLSDDIEESGKLQQQEGYKQLCRDRRDWSKTPVTVTETEKKQVSTPITKLQSTESNGSNNSNRSSTSSWSDEPANNSMDISTGHMVLAYMEDHLKNKQRLEQEWVALCGYEAEPSSTTVAFKAENKKKNRYPDKLPYDHNRVILNALVNATNSDYINASTVTDHDPRNPSYIVSQGPLGQTVSDFWQMIWEQGCVVIVMLSRLQDNGYQLCTRYWPEEGSEQYHIFEVHLVSEHIWCDDYLVRSFYLKNTRTGETRTVTQFHFQSWPAHGVPASTKALLEFRRKVNKSYRGRACPIVIHCSDGVGRSGTYVLIDMVLNRLSKGCKEIVQPP
jgi:receptor-type tyrosine-protein phosphatase N